MPHRPSAVRKANKATASQLLESVNMVADPAFDLRIVHAADLLHHDHVSIWTIFENNMRDLYNQSSFGWDPPSKERELFDTLSRFILVHSDNKMVAFVVFRFELEDCENVVYCYDLQVAQGFRRSGLGNRLMRWLEAIGTSWSMEKVMLTVFKVNKKAIGFYEASGFRIDPSSPGYSEKGDEVDDVDYEIMSKKLDQ